MTNCRNFRFGSEVSTRKFRLARLWKSLAKKFPTRLKKAISRRDWSSIYDLIFLASRVRKIATSCRRYKADREEWRDSYHWSPIYLGPFFPALPPPRQRVSVGCRACTLERQRKERKTGSADDVGISGSHLPLALSLGL